MKRCPYCKKYYPDKDIFCTDCGGPLEDVIEKISSDDRSDDVVKKRNKLRISDNASSGFARIRKPVRGVAIAIAVCMVVTIAIVAGIRMGKSGLQKSEYQAIQGESTDYEEELIGQMQESQDAVVESEKDNSYEEGKDTSVIETSRQKAFGGCFLLSENALIDLDLNQDGNTDTIGYRVKRNPDHDLSFTLLVNDRTLTVENTALATYSFQVESVYATDIDIDDEYKNIICQLPNYIYIFGYDDSEIKELDFFHGRLIQTSIIGDGKYTTYLDGYIKDDFGNNLCVKYNHKITNANQELLDFEVGKWDGESVLSYEDGFEMTLQEDHIVYTDMQAEYEKGTVSVGTKVNVTGFYDRGLRPMLYTYYIVCDNGEGWITGMV